LCGLTLFTVLLPVPAERVFVEDGPVETAGALLFLGAAIVAGIRSARVTDHRAWIMFAPIAGTAAFLSELSFGERLFGFTAPVVQGVKLDALHDVLQVGHFAMARHGAVTLVPVILAIALAIGAWLAIRLRRGAPDSASLLAGSVAAVTLSLIQDMEIDLLRPWLFQRFHIEESLEFVAGALLLAFVIRAGRAEPALRRGNA
jgi:hypothetical protein